MTQPLAIVGNWKMNGSRAMLAEARAIDRGVARRSGVKVSIAPPFTLIQAVAEAAQGIAVGGQDCRAEAAGAFTGDISAPMLVDAGASFVIVGHSERRTLHGESDADVRAKADAALAAGLEVIVCVGETGAQRDAGDAEQVVGNQVDRSMPESLDTVAAVSVAYEPVWAIGTGRVPSTAEIAAMHAAIRSRLVGRYGDDGADIAILYGGSVNPGNAADLLAVPDVGGALVGGASLSAESFLAIVIAAAGPDTE